MRKRHRRIAVVASFCLAFATPTFANFSDDNCYVDNGYFTGSYVDGGYFDAECGSGGSTPTVAISTIYISGSVPSDAVFKAGSAYAVTGERYVTACTSPFIYVYGIAHRGDGATCIDTSGTVFTDIGGYGVTQEGEIVADTCEGVFFPNGVPRDAALSVCMTDVN